ncbi:hypothetical protein, partial [Thiolapillus sp.]
MDTGEHPNARVAIVTDRDELDKQIVGVLRDAGMISRDDDDCRVPCDYIPKRSYPLFRTRQILNDWLT